MAAERNTGTKVVKLLIEHGADMTALTADGQSPLDLAKLNGKRAVAEYMQDAGSIA